MLLGMMKMETTFINNFKHTPVLLNECIDGLNIKPDGIYVDGTLGGGGHSSEILKRLTTGRLIAFDKDDDALNSTKEKLKELGLSDKDMCNGALVSMALLQKAMKGNIQAIRLLAELNGENQVQGTTNIGAEGVNMHISFEGKGESNE
jgi:hypothetical protein